MAEAQNRLIVTDFLPSRFQGDIIDSDLARAHYLAFTDYLHAHGIDEPDNRFVIVFVGISEVCR